MVWYPAEVNTSIRPGWFYHEEEDNQVRSLQELIRIYYNSVGGNATFLLNIPPTKEGLFHDNDVERLQEIGLYLNQVFKTNLLETAELSSDAFMKEHNIENVRTDDYQTFYKTEDGMTDPVINITWKEKQIIRHMILKENILCSQRVEKFRIEAALDDCFQTVYEGTVIGYKRIVPLVPVHTDKIRIRILDARVAPTLSFIGVY